MFRFCYVTLRLLSKPTPPESRSLAQCVTRYTSKTGIDTSRFVSSRTIEKRSINIGRIGVTNDAVRDAVSALRAKGHPTSTRVVRLQLKNTGSYSTISRILDEMGAKSIGNVAQLAEMPQEVQQRLADCVLSMWQTACKAGAAGAGKLKMQFDARVRTVSAKLVKERAARQRVESELCVAEGELRTVRSNRHVLEETVRTLREQLSVEKALLERSERECNQMRKLLGPLAPSASRVPARGSVAGRGRAGRHLRTATVEGDTRVMPL
jgi:hypothetical protein